MNILILTDFSVQAFNAAKYAVQLPHQPAKFYVAHAGNSSQERLTQEVLKFSEEDKDKTHQFFPLLAEENLVCAARKIVKEKSIDLIVMGISGQNAEEINGLGTNTYNVIRKVKCAVLVLPPTPFVNQKKIYFPLDSRFPIHKRSLQLFHQLRMPIQLIELWDLNPKNNEPNNYAKTLAGYAYHSNTFENSHDYAEKFWEKANTEANLILFFAKQLQVLEKILFKHQIQKNVDQKIPILILHE